MAAIGANANQQVEQADYPFPAGVLPPAQETTDTNGSTTTSGTDTETKSLSPVQEAAEGRQDQVAENQVATTLEQRDQNKKVAGVTSDIATQAANRGQGFQSEYDKAAADTQKWIDEARARAQVAQQRLDNQPPATYFKDGDTWHNALRGFALALGAVGDAKVVGAAMRAGHAPPTLDSVGNIINTDLERQKDQISRLKDSVVMARTGIDDAFKARQQMMQDIDLRGAAAYAQLERIGRARLAALGMSQADIDANTAINAIQEKRAEQHAKYVEPLFNDVKTHLETATRKDHAATERTQAIPPPAVLGAPGLANDLKTVGGYVPGIAEGVTPNALKDTEGQQYDAAADRLATELTVKKLGPRAAANPEVVKEIRSQYIPSATDKPETRAAKLQTLQQELNAQTYGMVGRQAAAPPAGPASAPPKSAPAAAIGPAGQPAAPAPAPVRTPPNREQKLRALKAKREEAVNAKDPERVAAIDRAIHQAVASGG